MRLESCSILAHSAVKGGYRRLTLDAPGIAAAAQPGQFVHLRIPTLPKSALRRPISVCLAADGRLTLLYKVVGAGTAALAELPAGARLDVLGPLGHGFPVATQSAARPMLVGGGYGVAPLLFLATRLERRGSLFVGGRTEEDILLADEFRALGWDVRIATEDGSAGVRGRVTVAIDAALASVPAGGAEWFVCGPDGLLRAVGALAGERGETAWLSLDKHMACGVGACLACVQTLRRKDGSTWIGRVCKDGPVFESREIVWPSPAERNP